MNNMIFSPADIRLPKGDKTAYEKWAVIACDQFTSEPEYWNEVRKICENAPSAHNLVLPEAYLGTPLETAQKESIQTSMQKVEDDTYAIENTLVYIRRTLPDGKIRHGIVGKVDLTQYDYTPKSKSAVRATEQTVLERIPPRCAVRGEATYELPHVMLFMDDSVGVFETLEKKAPTLEKLYDFSLMLGGGNIQGYKIDGEELSSVMASIESYEKSREGGIVYAVGDGNHSLAAAKAHFENVKTKLGDSAMNHPARYALVEVVDLNDKAIVFEPIYRIVKGCDRADLINKVKELDGEGEQKITMLTDEESFDISFKTPTHALTVGTLQNFLDDYVKLNKGAECDYIHDEESLKTLCKDKNTVGFIFDGMAKETLFPYAEQFGTLPRKTFSMGEARSKRYYIETRKIR